MDDSGPSEPAPPGLLDSLRRALVTAVDLLRIRLQLVGVDLETALQHWLGLLVWLLVAFFAAALATLMLVMTVLIAFWDTHRLLAAIVITALLGATAVIALSMVRRKIRTRPHPLASTLTELRQDALTLDRTEP